MKPHAIYPGTFDPPTNGHLNLVERSLEIFETVTVAIAQNSSKPTIFEMQERVDMLRELFKDNQRVVVESFSGLLVDYVERKEGHTVIRGIRSNVDFEYELAMAQANKHLNSHVETIFMVTDPKWSYLSSSMIRQIVGLGGNTKGLLPAFVEDKLAERLKGKHL